MNESVRKLIAGLQVIGGVAGAVGVVHEVATNRHPFAGLVVAAAAATLFLFAVFAGVMLWRDTRTGRVASVVCQLVQLPKVVGVGGSFLISYALDVSAIAIVNPLDPNRWGVNVNVWGLGYYSFVGGNGKGIGVSLTSLACLWFLLRRRVPAVPNEVGSPDAVAEFRQAQQAVRDAKAQARVAAEHPDWVPSRGMYLVLGVVVAVVVLVLSCCGLMSLIETPKTG